MTRSNPSLPPVTVVTPADFALPNNGLLARGQRNLVDSWLAENGFVVFRGFDIGSDRDFDDFVATFNLPNFPYGDSFSNAVRTNRTERVFTANEAPSEIEIFLHHEMAQT
jgi:Taurine catabolism dioxygenase TauD, TfdA family.